MKKLLLLLLPILLISCQGGDIDKVKPGMTQEEVLDIMGKPDDVVPTMQADSSGRMEETLIWQYGASQGIIFKDSKVDAVIKDIDQMMRDLQKTN